MSTKESVDVGRISELWVPEGCRSSEGLVKVEVFELADALHPDFEMPVLRKPSEGSAFATVRSEVCGTTEYL